MSDMNEFNQQIITEFRGNGGVVGGPFEGIPFLLLHTTGARSGLERVNPLVFQPLGDKWAVFASKAGAPSHPDWYHNLVANSTASIEVGTEKVAVRAVVVEGDVRDQIWNTQKELAPQFAEYETSAGSRVIPVVVLERV